MVRELGWSLVAPAVNADAKEPYPCTANKTDPQYQVDPVWKPYYSARESYNSYLDPPHPADAPLNATFWHRVTEVFERNEWVFAPCSRRVTYVDPFCPGQDRLPTLQRSVVEGWQD